VTVAAVVVTYNRRALLAECLAALHAQTRPPERILVVDNASTDGTAAWLREAHPEVDLLALATNEGGAGGFHEGMRRAHAEGADWLWLMDDDTIPRPDALAELLAAPARLGDAMPAPALLASRVEWADGRLHPMNVPGFERTFPDRLLAGAERGVMPLRTATFVSLLVHRSAVDRHGLPLKHFFIWSDDIEFSARVMRDGTTPGVLVPTSVVLHKTGQPYTAISTSGERFYFHVRNTLYMLRGGAWRPQEKPSLVFILFTSTLAYLRFNRFARANLAVVWRGVRDGLRPVASSPSV
jgi:GT2 family glycosyltransferase